MAVILIMKEVVQILKNGKIIVHNTDTCVGMAVDIMNKDAVELLYRVKQMPMEKPVSILCADLEMAKKYGVFSEKALELVKKHLPGALTLIVPRTDTLPEWINPDMGSIGIRIPDDEFSLAMAWELGNPVTTTSCNVSGELVCLSDVQVKGVFAEKIDKGDVFVAFEGDTQPHVSTIVRIDGEDLEIVRQGAIDIHL